MLLRKELAKTDGIQLNFRKGKLSSIFDKEHRPIRQMSLLLYTLYVILHMT